MVRAGFPACVVFSQRQIHRNTKRKTARFRTVSPVEEGIREEQSDGIAERACLHAKAERQHQGGSRGISRVRCVLTTLIHRNTKKTARFRTVFLVGRGGFEPPKAVPTDLQSAPFGHSGIFPYGAGGRSRTNNLLITNQLLCH